eukprot:jgi/Botrbrau1/23312/Bobra.0102s0050.2
MTRSVRDFYFLKAKAQGFLARSAFKLQEIQKSHRIIRPGQHILDLGCCPGAWLQVICQELGPPTKGGRVLGMDIQDCDISSTVKDPRVQLVQADALKLRPSELLEYAPGGFHAVLSDMCHNTVGSVVADVARSLALARAAASIALGPRFSHGLLTGHPPPPFSPIPFSVARSCSFCRLR